MQHIDHLNSSAAVPLDRPDTGKSYARTLVRGAALIGVLVAVLAVAAVLYVWFSGGNGQASAAITAPSLELQPGDTRSLFSITANTSEARFIIDELLIGQPTTVVGVTNDVAGEMLIDLENPSNSVLGAIRVNVRTLQTDNEFRNRALRGQILQSDRPEYEFATFTPVTLVGLPEAVTVGESFSFQIAGSLNLHGVSRDMTFDAVVTPISPTQVEGTASAIVLYRDFNISIPEAPGVADISDDVRLEIDFTAATRESQP
jgi:polyisoprenoid-binding protein YceI